jgi:muramoyltetrapeptide carboxypeptidase LdcA involved in peptidoglycan recycling
MPDAACLSAMILVAPRRLSLAARPTGSASYSGHTVMRDVQRLGKIARFRTNKLMKTGIVEHRQSRGQRAWYLGERFQISNEHTIGGGIIVCSQELGRSLSAGLAGRTIAEHTPGL